MKKIDNIEKIWHSIPEKSFDENIEWAVQQANVDGLFAEFGVAEGGTIKKAALAWPNYTWHGFDSFQGLPEDWRTDVVNLTKGGYACDVPNNLPSNVILHVGMFEETIPSFAENWDEDISFANIDCDLYSSTKTIFKYLGHKIKPGTILRFDEMRGYPGWKDHEWKAFREFLYERDLDCEYLSRETMEQVTVRIV